MISQEKQFLMNITTPVIIITIWAYSGRLRLLTFIIMIFPQSRNAILNVMLMLPLINILICPDFWPENKAY